MKPDIIHFSNDSEFYNFAVCQVPVIIPSTEDSKGYFTWNWTSQYLDACECGKKFYIHDRKSQIYKRGGVSYRSCFKPCEVHIFYDKRP